MRQRRRRRSPLSCWGGHPRHEGAVQPMSRAVLILRPEPGNSESLARATALGLQALSCPLFKIVPVAWEPPPCDQFDAVLLTSANALLCAGPALAQYLTLPAIAVGPSTAQAARDAGFASVTEGAGDVADILALGGKQSLLHLCGVDVAGVAIPSIERCAVYASDAVEIPSGFAEALSSHPIATLHSVRAALRFTELVDMSATPRGSISIVTISAKVADAAGKGWQEVAIAAKPRDEDVLRAALRLIQPTKAQAFS